MKRFSTLVMSFALLIGCGLPEQESIAPSLASRVDGLASQASDRGVVDAPLAEAESANPSPQTVSTPASVLGDVSDSAKGPGTVFQACGTCWARCQHGGGGWGGWHGIGNQRDCRLAAYYYCIHRVGDCQGTDWSCASNPPN